MSQKCQNVTKRSWDGGQGGLEHPGVMQGCAKGLNWQTGAAACPAAGMDWQKAPREALGAVDAEGHEQSIPPGVLKAHPEKSVQLRNEAWARLQIHVEDRKKPPKNSAAN